MRSLDQLGAARAADAMNAINEVILHSWFMALFFGSTLLYLILAVVAVFNTGLDGRWLLFAAGSVYVVGMFVCTVLFNVPLNNTLANAESQADAKADAWMHYFKYWTRWNHLRTVSSTLACAFFIQAI